MRDIMQTHSAARKRAADGIRVLVVGTLVTLVAVSDARGLDQGIAVTDLTETRRIDGASNHFGGERGTPGIPYVRRLSNDYADGAHAPSGAERPSPRAVSNAVCAQEGDRPNAAGVSDMFWQWGQFLDHDLDHTPEAQPAEPLFVSVPAGDPWFDPFGEGAAIIPLLRSAYTVVDGVREQTNSITAFIDASHVYGSDEVRARALRTLDGTGRLRESEGHLLPYNEEGLENAPSTDAAYFLAGDVRANEQCGLTAMHTLFVREHNYWAKRIARVAKARRGSRRTADGRRRGRRLRRDDFGLTERRELTGDEIYELARMIVGAEMQAVTYNEFLPVLLGKDALRPYSGYREDVDPSITNSFAGAAFRVGHTMLSPTLRRLTRSGRTVSDGDLSLADAFFSPEVVAEGGIEPLLRGLVSQRAQEIDTRIVDEVRNLLFGAPGAGGLDLAALNIQRGRDHGLPSYTAARVELGLPAVTAFDQISSDTDVTDGLAEVYARVEDVDLWVGAIAEDHVPGAVVGETLRALLIEQFEALRDGDRFFYLEHLPPHCVRLVERQTLRRIIRRSSRIGGEFTRDPWHAR